MIKIHFHIHYFTAQDGIIAVEYFDAPPEGKNPKILYCHTYGGGHWMGEIEVSANTHLYYRYAIVSGETLISEAGKYRVHQVKRTFEQIFLHDQWRAPNDIIRIFQSNAFTEVIFRQDNVIKSRKPRSVKRAVNTISFQLNAPNIPPHTVVGITGNIEELGGWKKAILLNNEGFPFWNASVGVREQSVSVEYKYVLCDPQSGAILSWEAGDNRSLHYNFPERSGNCLAFTHEGFRHLNYRWRGAGMAIPVFSLRSKQGLGIGEFMDLKGMIDLAQASSMNFVQILPVNDTIAAKTWKDSYPYSAISVFALHPMYINIDALGAFRKKGDKEAYLKDKERLNQLDQVDFVGVMEAKLRYLRIFYQEKKDIVFKSKAYQLFFKENKEWLVPYGAFCYLRDLYGTADFNTWEKHSVFEAAAINKLCGKRSRAFDEIAFYYFLQFHADKQLREVRAYGREKKVVLKGDLPIGVYRHSCDAWLSPELYHMDGQSGAPPDDYAEDGQNWGFPTYNWEVMARDNFLWWRKRMQSLAKYFDALRIDHILGFFRIWEIPIDQVSGILGKFNPRLPLTAEELADYGISGDMKRYTQPYIREYMLDALFGEEKDHVIKEFLDNRGNGVYDINAKVNTQSKINQRFDLKKYKKYQHLKSPLSRLVGEVLMLEEPGSKGTAFNPRITLHKTFSYKDLDPDIQRKLDAVYNDYFYVRHNDYWREQALWKLPALLEATDMLICGEDLGMIPASVEGVMRDLNIISLEIQRMPKGPTAFGVPSQYDYMTVCSPSCHDMSTIRGWWESDPDRAQKFYNLHMHRAGIAPLECTGDLVRFINQEHLNSPSVIAIFPIQDLLGMDEKLRKDDAASEQINDPADSNHYWRYRLHLNIEEILGENSFIEQIKWMVRKSGR